MKVFSLYSDYVMFPVQEKLTFQLKPGRKNGELVVNRTMLDRLNEMMVSVCTHNHSFML